MSRNRNLNVVQSEYAPKDRTALWLKKEADNYSLMCFDGNEWVGISGTAGSSGCSQQYKEIDPAEPTVYIEEGVSYYNTEKMDSITICAKEEVEPSCRECVFYITGISDVEIQGVYWSDNDVPSFTGTYLYELVFKYVPYGYRTICTGCYTKYLYDSSSK